MRAGEREAGIVVVDAGAGDGPHRAVFEGQAETATVAEARRWARGVLQGWDADELEWELSQLLTEVVTNAVLHARTPLRVVLRYQPGSGRVRCEVTDLSPVMPRVRRHSLEATTGRGLRLLEQVASQWGTQADGKGKTVWFEVDGAGDVGLDVDDLAAALADLATPARASSDGAGRGTGAAAADPRRSADHTGTPGRPVDRPATARRWSRPGPRPASGRIAA